MCLRFVHGGLTCTDAGEHIAFEFHEPQACIRRVKYQIVALICFSGQRLARIMNRFVPTQ